MNTHITTHLSAGHGSAKTTAAELSALGVTGAAAAAILAQTAAARHEHRVLALRDAATQISWRLFGDISSPLLIPCAILLMDVIGIGGSHGITGEGTARLMHRMEASRPPMPGDTPINTGPRWRSPSGPAWRSAAADALRVMIGGGDGFAPRRRDVPARRLRLRADPLDGAIMVGLSIGGEIDPLNPECNLGVPAQEFPAAWQLALATICLRSVLGIAQPWESYERAGRVAEPPQLRAWRCVEVVGTAADWAAAVNALAAVAGKEAKS